MMARSTKGSNQRPDTLMQDRTSANSMKVLLQRTAGPYMWVRSVASGRSRRSWHVRYASNSDPIGVSQRSVARCQEETRAGAATARAEASLLDHLVGAGEQRGWHFKPSAFAVLNCPMPEAMLGSRRT